MFILSYESANGYYWHKHWRWVCFKCIKKTQRKKPNTLSHTQNKQKKLLSVSAGWGSNVTAPKIILDITGTLNCLLAWWFMIQDGFKSRSHWKTAFIIMIVVVVKLPKFSQLQCSYNRSYSKVKIYQLLLRSCHKRFSLRRRPRDIAHNVSRRPVKRTAGYPHRSIHCI